MLIEELSQQRHVDLYFTDYPVSLLLGLALELRLVRELPRQIVLAAVVDL